MSDRERELSIVAGALAKAVRPKAAQSQDAIAKRWRVNAADSGERRTHQDVIPLLAGWIRRLEREAGTDATETR